MQWERASDEKILAVSGQDPVHFNIIVRRYRKSFIRVAARILVVKEDDAEDVVQEALVKMWENAAMYRKLNGATAKSWLYKIVVNQALTWRRRKQYEHMGGMLDGAYFDDLADARHFQEEVRMRAVRGFIDLLPQHYREVILLHYFEEESYRTISARLGITVPAIKMRLYHARIALKNIAGDLSY